MKHCCIEMTKRIEHKCEQHKSPFECPDSIVVYSDNNKKYGIIIHDGGSSYIVIDFCPWCGKSL